jgi:5'-3' exonuclease
MKTYVLIDFANLFFRARHVVRGTLEDKTGLSIQTVLSGIRKSWRDFKADHIVVCLEGRSWRKDIYPPYKRQRTEARAALSPSEAEEEKIFWETFDEFKNFIKDKTNCTVLHNQRLEADDLIAGWIRYHPNDQHIIVSTDGDFAQLIAKNVKQYNGVTGILATLDGYFDEKGKPVIDNKTKEVKQSPEPEWLLFEKCIRGDSSDNIFSAYPGVRIKGTKNKVGLREAFEDRHTKGWAWNNFMLQKWLDHTGQQQRVRECYERNQMLCDLNAQPEDIKKLIEETISSEISQKKSIPQVGIKLIKFCAEHDLVKISEQIESYAEPLNARYTHESHSQRTNT